MCRRLRWRCETRNGESKQLGGENENREPRSSQEDTDAG